MVDRSEIASEILRQAATRGPGKSICPSEVARALMPDWRPLMPEIRAEAARLAAEHRIVLLQKGEPVDPVAARGPIRLAVPPKP